MLNRFAKFLLVATSLSPVLGAVAVNKFARNKPWTSWAAWLAVAMLLAVICWLLLWYASNNAEKQRLYIKEFDRNDKEVLAFLLGYLLPFISPENMAFEGEWMTGAYILAIIFLVVSHAGAFHFNPVMGLLGFHFYGIRNKHGISVLLISKKELRRAGYEVEAVRLAYGIYLQTGDGDV